VKCKNRILRHIVLILLFLNLSTLGFAQCGGKNFAYKVGEKIDYNIAYSLGFIWVDAGKVSFEVKRAYYRGKPVLHFYSFGTSLPNYDWFFRVRDVWESYSDTCCIKPYYFYRNSEEGSYRARDKYWYDYEHQKVYVETQNSNKSLLLDTLQIMPCLLDLMSGIYYVRNVDFGKLKINDKIDLQFILENEVFDKLYARYLGLEEITLHDGQKYMCYKIRPYLVEGTIFEGGEKMSVWISSDGNNVPILVEAEVLVGSIKAEVQKVSGLKYPFKPMGK